jgi:phosphodiesterase/alkaline phosphatase D-like protein
VNPNGYQTLYWYVYGTTSPLSPSTGATQTEVFSAGSGSSAVAAPATLTALAASTTVYYQLVANNNNGFTYGSTLSFTSTLSATPSPPIVTTGSASSITSTGATLAGTVNPNGMDTFCYFLYGTSSTLVEYSGTAVTYAGSGATAVPFVASVTGLAPNTTYYYRLLGTNGAGGGFGSILSFTTPQN